MSTQPHWLHQFAGARSYFVLEEWSQRTGLGLANWAPGLIFAEDDNVAPDVVWVSNERLATILGPDGKLHGAPELVVEVLSPGAENERRDREIKLDLYARRGVQEYWIVNWQRRQVAVYRSGSAGLQLAETFSESDTLRSPLLPDFACPVGRLFPPA